MAKIFVSAQEVADRAGVSRSAVSRTFTPGASVAPETRRKVLEAAEALGYHVNQLARGLMRNESGIVCLIVADMGSPYRATMIKALTDELQAAGKVAMLINTDRSDDSVDAALRQALRYRADASVILSGMPDKSIVDLCMKNGQSLILINRDDTRPGPLRINVDDREAARTILTAFLRAGCSRLAFANSEAGTPALVAREEGFVEAARQEGFDVIVERFGRTGYDAGKVLAQRLMMRRERPDAVFCATDLLACGFMDAARHQFALTIPGDVCVAGFDDIEQAAWSSYDLTTFAQPVAAIARKSVAWLAGGLSSGEAPEPLELHADLVWRRSIRAA